MGTAPHTPYKQTDNTDSAAASYPSFRIGYKLANENLSRNVGIRATSYKITRSAGPRRAVDTMHRRRQKKEKSKRKMPSMPNTTSTIVHCTGSCCGVASRFEMTDLQS